MDIQFRCTNISQFDPDSGDYVYCEQLLQAEDKHVGLKVRCPKCNQTMTVPSPAMATAVAGSSDESSTDEFGSGEISVQVESQLAYSRFNPKTRCPKCGSLLDEDKRCTACRYVMPLVNRHRLPLDKMDVKPAGFQLWLRTIFADGIDTKVVEAAAHSLVAMSMLLCAIAAVLLGGSNLFLVLIFLGLILSIYVYLVWQAKRLATKPAAQVPFLLKPIWNLILLFARNMNWQKYDARLKDRKILDVRNHDFGDRELLALEGLNLCEVLDAERTNITDNSLLAMHGLKHLRCLVVRKTHVTAEGVFRLQQAIPRCWIWY